MQRAGIHRGCYHFHRKAIDPIEQAQFFCSTIYNYVIDDDILVVDVEEGGEDAAQLMKVFQYIESEFPRNIVMIYSARYILQGIPTFLRQLVEYLTPHPLNAIQMTMEQRDYFKTIPVWTAGYPADPDPYNTVPSFYIPDPTRWGDVWMWQYTPEGKVSGAGVEGLDCNWIAPKLIEILGAPPAAPIIDGYQQLRRYNSDVYLWRDALTGRRAHVTNTHGALKTLSSVAGGAVVGVNGDGWPSDAPFNYHYPLSIATSDGTKYQQFQYDFRPWLDVSRDNRITIDWPNLPEAEYYNTVSGTRFLVTLAQNFFAASTDPEHITERNPRTAAGRTLDGKLILCVVDGRSTVSAGVTLKELADIMLEAGAWYAIELDGGGSSTMTVNGQVVNRPSDGAERPAVNHLLVYEGGTMLVIKGTAKGSVTIRNAPAGSALNPPEYLKLGDVIEATENSAQWLHLSKINGVPVVGTKWASAGSSQQYIAWEWVTVPDPQPDPDPEPQPAAHVVEVLVDNVSVYRTELD
jgi:hypothetical protein